MHEKGTDGETSTRYLGWSFGLLALTLVSFLLTGVILDSFVAQLSLTLQRWLGGLTLVLPALLGALMGILALRQPDRRPLLAILGIILNGIIALFFIAVLSIAG